MKRGRPGRPLGRRRLWPALYPCPREGRSPFPPITKNRRMGGSKAETIRQPRDRLNRQPQERQHSAANGGTRDRLPPAIRRTGRPRDEAKIFVKDVAEWSGLMQEQIERVLPFLGGASHD